MHHSLRISARAAFLKLRINPKCRGSIQRKGPRGPPNRPSEKRTEQTRWWPQAKGNVPSRPRHGRRFKHNVKPNQKPDSVDRYHLEGRHGKSQCAESTNTCCRAEALSGVAGTKQHNIAVSGERNGETRGAAPIVDSCRGTTPRNSGQLSTNCVTGCWCRMWTNRLAHDTGE